MAIETTFKYKGKGKGDEDFLKDKLKGFDLVLQECKYKDEIWNQYTILFAGKYIWGDYFTEEDTDLNYFIVKYSSPFKDSGSDKDVFIQQMLSLGFEIDE